MNPGQACGTGWHPATQLCLQAMERHVAPGSSLLDLEPARAFSRWPPPCLAPAPSTPATSTLQRSSPRTSPTFFLGSARSVRSASLDLVVANINAEALLALAPQIARIRKPAGRVILSGFPRRHLERVRAAFPARTELLEQDGWIALVASRVLLRIPAPARERPRDVARLDRLLDHVGHLKAQEEALIPDGVEIPGIWVSYRMWLFQCLSGLKSSRAWKLLPRSVPVPKIALLPWLYG